MNKKRILLTAICILFLVTGCSNSNKYNSKYGKLNIYLKDKETNEFIILHESSKEDTSKYDLVGEYNCASENCGGKYELIEGEPTLELYKNNIVAIKDGTGKYFLYDFEKETILTSEYNTFRTINNNDKTYYVAVDLDKDGNIASSSIYNDRFKEVKKDYDNIGFFSLMYAEANNNVILTKKNNKYGLLDSVNLKEIVKPDYELIRLLDNYAILKNDDKVRLYNYENKKINKSIYEVDYIVTVIWDELFTIDDEDIVIYNIKENKKVYTFENVLYEGIEDKVYEAYYEIFSNEYYEIVPVNIYEVNGLINLSVYTDKDNYTIFGYKDGKVLE